MLFNILCVMAESLHAFTVGVFRHEWPAVNCRNIHEIRVSHQEVEIFK